MWHKTYMKAIQLFDLKRLFRAKENRTIVVRMDLYKVKEEDGFLPFRFSWIAFDQADPSRRILFDCHSGKEPHFHIDGEEQGNPFHWSSIENAIEFFHKKMIEHFGDLVETNEEGE